ncbi:MAG: TIGR00266 family protein [Magnetococcales bacterium]|nr:TIGR00266 family protein [Magnetococcales bacterium]
MTTCTQCHRTVADTAFFCPNCSSPLFRDSGPAASPDTASTAAVVSPWGVAAATTALPDRTPPARYPRAKRCHEVDYEIIGHDTQLVEIELDPGETVIAEAGAMNYMEDGIVFAAKMGDGSTPDAGIFSSLLAVGQRLLTGESLFVTHFTNEGVGKRRVAFAAPFPGRIIPLDLAALGGEVLCQKDAFLCAALGTSVGIAFTQRLGAGFFGGEGFILQKLVGDGFAFLHACGAIVQKELRGELLRVDTGCLVAMTPGIDYAIERAGGLKSMFFGGEGFFLATLQGHGTVWLQSLPFSRLADRILANSSSSQGGGGGSQGESSLLGNLSRFIER